MTRFLQLSEEEKRMLRAEFDRLQEKAGSQRRLAADLDVAQSLVSACAAGRRRPSSELYLRMARVAGVYGLSNDVLRFLEHAGIGRALMESALGHSTETSGTVEIRPSEKVPQHDAVAQVFPKSLVPHPLATTYVRLSDKFYGPLLESGDLLVIDESQTDLRKLRGVCVAFYRDPQFAEAEPPGEQRGATLAAAQRGLFQRTGVFAAWLLYDVGRTGSATTVAAVPTRLYGGGGYLREPIDLRKPEVIPGDSAVVLGRVIAWVPQEKLPQVKAGRERKNGRRKRRRSRKAQG